jgi:hypothetical protein
VGLLLEADASMADVHHGCEKKKASGILEGQLSQAANAQQLDLNRWS